MRCYGVCLAVLLTALGCSSSESAVPAQANAGTGGKPSENGGAGTVAGTGGTSTAAGAGGTSAAAGAGGTSSAGTGGTSAGAGATAGTAGSASAATGPIDCRQTGDGKSTISFVNQCSGTLSFRGSNIQGGDLAPGEHACRDVGDATTNIPAIRFWGYIGEDPGNERYTLAELTLNTDFNDFDWYNISHVDASNLPMSIAAVDMPKCRTLSCPNSLLADCPAVGQEKGKDGQVISCFSPDRNDPNSPVAQYFEASCKDAYSWSGDDQDSVVACAGEDYDVVFCP